MHRLMAFFLLCTAVFCKNHHTKPSPPEALQGHLNLTGWNFHQNGPVQLQGEWEFYWKKFYPFQKFQTRQAPVADTFLDFPGQWKGMPLNDSILPREGFATLRLKVQMDAERNSPLAIRINRWSNPLAIYINDEKCTSIGTIGTSSGTEVYDSRPHIARFIPPCDTFDIIMQVSNFSGKKSSCIYPISMSLYTQLLRKRTADLSWFFIIFGAVFFIGICLLLAFITVRPLQYALLFLGLSCMIISVRSLFMGEAQINDIFPHLSISLKFRIELFLLYSFVISVNLYSRALFPEELKWWFIRMIIISHAHFILVVLLFDYDTALCTQLPHHTIITADGLYVLAMLGRAMKVKRKGAAIFMTSLGILFITVVHDILVFHHIIETTYLLHIGFLIFIVIQTLLVTYLYTKSASNISILTQKLDTTKNELKRLQESSVPEQIDMTAFYHSYKITSREKDVIELIITGASNNEIAEKLYISFHTVRRHLNNIYRKCDISDRNEFLSLVKEMTPEKTMRTIES